MGRSLIEDITYYIETILEKVGKFLGGWRYLSWETKVRVRGLISVLGIVLAYNIYTRSWISLSELQRATLVIYSLLALGILASAILEVFDIKHF